MNEIATVGLDLAKNVFQLTGSIQRERRFCASSFGGGSGPSVGLGSDT
jgi:hypothetical protein